MKYILLAFILIVLLCIFDYFRYTKKRKKVEESFLIMPTKYGDVEYIDLGPKDAPVILFATGGGAGIDSVYALDWLLDIGFRVLSINRPGYYNLPLDAINEISEQADIYHAVVEKLGITSVHVFGVSMGGALSLHYAQKYPTDSLVLWSAVTGTYHPNPESMESPLGRVLLSPAGKNLISWMMGRSIRLAFRETVTTFLQAEAELPRGELKKIADQMATDPQVQKSTIDFVESTTPMGKLYDGMMWEVEQTAKEWTPDWESITCPALVIASLVDKDVAFDDHYTPAVENLPNVEGMTVTAGGHFIWWGDEGKTVIERTRQFLLERKAS
jgi:pimeloyl-ACP methyl ester carboxylesterase